jgi:hypothetical protein
MNRHEIRKNDGLDWVAIYRHRPQKERGSPTVLRGAVTLEHPVKPRANLLMISD